MSRATSPVRSRPVRIPPGHGIGIRGTHATDAWSHGSGGGAHEMAGLPCRDGSQARFGHGATLAARRAGWAGPRGPGQKDEGQERWPLMRWGPISLESR
jgi:hypothetical protein